MKLFNKETLNLFDWFLIIGIISLNVIYSVLTKEFDFIGSLAGISGVMCVVLVAKRSMANYIFGVINVSLYAWIAYKSQIYGDAALNALYYFPMQFIGWYSWIKRNGGKNSKGVTDESIVKTKKMNRTERLFLFATCFILVLLIGYILDRFTNDPQPYKDSVTTVLSVIAMFLMVKTYMEQWVLWVIVNTVSVVMWIVVLYRGDDHAGLMVIMWLFYLANSLNGLRIWNKSANAA